MIDKYKMGKHFHTTITDTTLTYRRDQARIDTEAELDGISVPRTSVDTTTLDPAQASVLGLQEPRRQHRTRLPASSRPTTWTLRPIHHRLDDRVKAHVLICLLACYLIWHLRKAWATTTFTDYSTHPNALTPSRPHSAPPTPTPRPPTNTTPTASRYAASAAACSTTWPPSPATRSATTTPASKCPRSPNPPPTNAAPSHSLNTPIPLTTAA